MSTRATILIKKGCESYRVYHHCDGYPEGIGKDIKEYLAGKKQWYADDIVNDLVKGKVANDGSYEITSCQHGDEQYAYLIDCATRELKCYKVGWDEFDWKEEKLVNIPD